MFVTKGALLVVVLWVATPVQPGLPDSPEALGRALPTGVQNRDASAIRALVDPQSAAEAEKLEPGVVQRNLTGMLRRDLPDETIIAVDDPVAGMKGYDPATQSVSLGTQRLQFPLAPQKIVTLRHQVNTPNGIRVQAVTVGAIERNGRWWVVVAALVKQSA
jgi:hypothetical protein